MNQRVFFHSLRPSSGVALQKWNENLDFLLTNVIYHYILLILIVCLLFSAFDLTFQFFVLLLQVQL